MIITVWYLGSKNKNNEIEWIFNHYSEGYDETQKYPIYKFESQKNWKNGKWLAKKAKLIDNVIVDF